MSDRISVGAYNQKTNRDLFVFGPEQLVQDFRKVFEALPFVRVLSYKQFTHSKTDLYFYVAAAKFKSPQHLQHIVKEFEKHKDVHAHKIIYEQHLATLSQSERFFATEIGASLVVAGKDRDADLRAYVKKIALEAEQIGSIAYYEGEIAKFSSRLDREGLRLLDEKLGQLSKESEDVLRLRAQIAYVRGNYKIYEGNLKRILQLNAQSLWAATELGKHYLRTKRPSEGIELLAKMSGYQELNGERLLCLGDAYLNAGDITKAEATLKKGQALSNSTDARFDEGLAKAKVAVGKVDEALSLLKNHMLPESVVSYLNTRAILAIKTKNFDDGFKFYDHAVSRGVNDPLIRSKLHYNFGLGHIKANQLEHAAKHFAQSLKLGGESFQRAKRPLEIVQKLIQNQDKRHYEDHSAAVDSFDFEDFNKPMRDMDMDTSGSTKPMSSAS